MRTIAIDSETFYIKPKPSDPGYSVGKLGNWRYCNDPKFDCYLLSVCDGSQSWAGHPKDFNWDSLDGATLLSHNKGFDAAVCRRMHELGLAPELKNEWFCTANLTSFLCNRRSLAEASSHLLGVKVDKGMRDYMNGKTWAEAVKEGKGDSMIEYAKGDVVHCRNLWEKYSHLWTPTERALSDMTINQGHRGVAIDIEKLRRYKGVVQMVLFHIEQSLPWVLEGAKVTSPKAIAEQCRRVGIPSPPIKSHEGGEEAFILWEEIYGPKFSWVSNVSRYRSINKILTTLETIEERLRPDGTIDFSLLYCGSHTARWSGGGSGLNMQNLLKSPIYVRDDYSISEGGEPDVEYREAINMRSLFIPRPGHEFIICDLAQIEPRVLAWLSGNFELLERVKTGMSVYEAHARDTMNWTGGELKKENALLYKTAKARTLGLGYGCGKDKFKVVAKTLADLDITLEESTKMVNDFRAANPKITALWTRLDNALKASHGGDFEMGLPSGRTMRYEGVLRESRPRKNAEGKIEFRMVYTAGIGGQRYMLYGPLLVENATQAVSRDVFGEHLLACERAGLPSVFHSHDENIVEAPIGTDPRAVEEIMSTTPDWIAGLPLAAEAMVSRCYTK